MPDQQFVRSPELRWLLDWETVSWSHESCHALVELDFNHLLVRLNSFPAGHAPHFASLGMLGNEVPARSHLLFRDLRSKKSESTGELQGVTVSCFVLVEANETFHPRAWR